MKTFPVRPGRPQAIFLSLVAAFLPLIPDVLKERNAWQTGVLFLSFTQFLTSNGVVYTATRGARKSP